MTRLDTFTFRVNDEERRLIELIAQKLERNSSDTMRLIVRQTAAAMGLIPDNDGIVSVEVKRARFEVVEE